MKKLLTPRECAEMLSLSVSGIYNYVYEKKIPYKKVGRRLRFDPEEIERWIEHHPVRERRDSF